jgi:cytochrome oxidase assembly protein ShyY1
VRQGQEWKRVTATGEYDVAASIFVRYQTRDGQAGVDVVVPLRTAEGPVLLVDRGWMAGSNRGADVSDVPPPPGGQVSVTGWVRLDGTGSSTRVSEQSVRSVSSVAISKALDLEAYGGFVDLDTETPAATMPLEKAELPDLSNGPHFFYGLQWWFFGLLAVVGFFYLLYDEWRGPRRATGRTRRWLQASTLDAEDRTLEREDHPADST